MKNPLLLVALLLTVPVLARPAAADAIPWQASYDAALAQAKTAHTLLMVDVYTDWCGWCKKLDSDVYPDAGVVKAAAQYTPVKINAEKDGKAVADKYSVTGYPTILFLDTDGTLVGKIDGYEAADQFAGDLNKIADDNRQFPILQAKVKADPNDMDSALRLAQMDVKRGLLPDALALTAALEAKGQTARLAPLYDQIGDSQAGQGKLDDALASYRKAVADSPSTDDLISARVGIVNTLLHQDKKDDAKAALKDLIATPGLNDGMKQRAQQFLDRLNGAAAAK